jgi:Site-specific DNA methylase
MKTPIVYYGGKSNMLKHILPLIPAEHSIYVEPFFGGGAVFFGKEPSEVEVINDNLDYAINFYRVAKDHFPELQRMIQGTLHAESERILSLQMLKGQVQADSIRRAWAFWCQTQLTFAHKVFGGLLLRKIVSQRQQANGSQILRMIFPSVCGTCRYLTGTRWMSYGDLTPKRHFTILIRLTQTVIAGITDMGKMSFMIS